MSTVVVNKGGRVRLPCGTVLDNGGSGEVKLTPEIERYISSGILVIREAPAKKPKRKRSKKPEIEVEIDLDE